MLIWPEASRAQNSMAAVSAEGSTVWVLMRCLNSSCRRSIAFVVRASSAKATTAGRSSAVRRAGRALEDHEPGPLQLRHELLGEQAGGHLPGGAAPGPAA